MTLPQVAGRLSVSVRTVRRRIESGELPAIRIGSSPQAPVRVDHDELEAWLAAHDLRPPEKRNQP